MTNDISLSSRSIVLSIAGNDSSGLAGVSSDTRVQTALGVHTVSVLTATTAQNNHKVLSINPVSLQCLDDQFKSIQALPIQAIKIGLIGSLDQCEMITRFVAESSAFTVLDPVLATSSGHDLSSDFISILLNSLLPECDLITPNRMEAEKLSGCVIKTPEDVEHAAQVLLGKGVKAVLIKGGHLNENKSATVDDYFVDSEASFWLKGTKIQTTHTRGTGCALSSAIASAVSLGYGIYDAIVIGKMAISQGLRQGYGLADEHGPVHITHFPNEQIDLPKLSRHYIAENNSRPTFPSCEKPMGIYPVVDRASWIPRLSACGIKIIQLRVKDLQGDELENEISEAIHLAKQTSCQLYINDYWELAIQLGAYGVHLGQEDLDEANIGAIQHAGLRLGISTHCHYEVARAHAYQPSYIACGPIYHTNTKQMPWVPHGLDGLAYWRKTLDYPLVAIGGINESRLEAVCLKGADSVAMITAITLAESPEQTAQQFVSVFNEVYDSVSNIQEFSEEK